MPRPRRIFALAFNYRDAVRERGMDEPAEPVLFMKHPETVIGPGEPVILPAGVGGVTYESELAVFIGRGGRDIPREAAMEHVVAARTCPPSARSAPIWRRWTNWVRSTTSRCVSKWTGRPCRKATPPI